MYILSKNKKGKGKIKTIKLTTAKTLKTFKSTVEFKYLTA